MPGYEEWVLKRYPHWTLYLHANQYYLGRAYAWLNRHGEMQRLTDLHSAEYQDLFEEVLPEYEAAVAKLWLPGHVNYAWLGNHMHEHGGHGHMHLIPRYKKPVLFSGVEFRDEQWGKNYAPYPEKEIGADVMVTIREALKESLRKLA